MLKEPGQRKERQRLATAAGGVSPGYVLTGALCLTALAVIFVAKNEIAQRRAEFVASVQQIEENIRSRMDSYVTLLRGSAAMAARENLTAQQFSRYVTRLGLAQNYPGAQGIGFSARVTAAQKQGFE